MSSAPLFHLRMARRARSSQRQSRAKRVAAPRKAARALTIADLNRDVISCIIAFLDSHEIRCFAAALSLSKHRVHGTARLEHLALPELLDPPRLCPQMCMCLRAPPRAAYVTYLSCAVRHGHMQCAQQWLAKHRGEWPHEALAAALRAGNIQLARTIHRARIAQLKAKGLSDSAAWAISDTAAVAAGHSGNAACIEYVSAYCPGVNYVSLHFARTVVTHNNAALFALLPRTLRHALSVEQTVYNGGHYNCQSKHGDAQPFAADMLAIRAICDGTVPIARANIGAYRWALIARGVCRRGSTKGIRELLSHAPLSFCHLLIIAIEERALEIVRMLHEEYSVPFPAAALAHTAEHRQFDCVAYMRECKCQWTTDVAQRILATGCCALVDRMLADGYPQSQLLLHWAIPNPCVLWRLCVHYKLPPTEQHFAEALRKREFASARALFDYGLPRSDAVIGTIISYHPADAARMISMARARGYPVPANARILADQVPKNRLCAGIHRALE